MKKISKFDMKKDISKMTPQEMNNLKEIVDFYIELKNRRRNFPKMR